MGKTAGKAGAVSRSASHLHAKNICVFVLCLLTALFLATGCKYTDVLTEHLEDPDLGVLDEDAEPIYKSNPDAPERPDLEDVSVSESDDENEQVEVLPHYDPDAPDNGPTKQRRKSEETPHDEIASEATEEGESDRANADAEGEGDAGTGEPDDEEEPPADDEGEGDEENPESEDDQISDEVEDEGDESSDGGIGGETVVVDPDEGTAQEAAKGTVAAVGEYATIAQMLGGAGAVVACDEAWYGTCTGCGLFPGELERVTVAFSGDGTEVGCCDVDLLIDTVKPSVILWDGSSPALSDDDRARLEEAGIAIQPVPTLGAQTTEDYAVVSAVAAVAAVLSEASGLQYDPVTTLDVYRQFHDEALRTCYSANSGYSYKSTDGTYAYLYQDTPLDGLSDSTTTRYTTVYIDELWNPGISRATMSQNAETATDTIRLLHDGQSVDIEDGVALSAATATDSYMLIDYYLQLSGVMNNAYDTAKPAPQGLRYVLMPGSTAVFGRSDGYSSRVTGTAMFYNSGDGTVAANWHALGDADFPALLTANDEIAQAVYASSAKEDGLYHMGNSYQIIVVPTGAAGSWAEGHVDSFLLALWAFRIQDPGSLDVAGEYAASFYETFFRCTDWAAAISDWNTAYEGA